MDSASTSRPVDSPALAADAAALPVDAAVRPVDSTERIELLDVLRGLALAGVFAGNAVVFFSGLIFLPRALAGAWTSGAAFALFNFLIAGKAMTTFAFLFGLGFSVQLLRVSAGGRSIAPLYTRRLLVLLCIGVLHCVALWFGDILSMYAIAGFGLLAFRGVSSRRLAAVALVLIFVLPPLVALWDVSRVPPPDAMARSQALRAAALEAWQGSSYRRIEAAGLDFYLHDFLRPGVAAHYGIVLGKFLLGLIAGRARLFHDVPAHRATHVRLLRWGLVLGVAAAALSFAYRRLHPSAPGWMALLVALREVGDLGLAAFYASSIALLFQVPRVRRVLRLIAPAGRMALTNYVSQSALALLVFSGLGLGLVGRLPPGLTLALVAVLYAVQIAASHAWLRRFRFGPLEWAWRSLTYGEVQPLRAAPAT